MGFTEQLPYAGKTSGFFRLGQLLGRNDLENDASAKFHLDGKECKIDDLKPGQRVRVTTQRDNKDVVLRVEALDKNSHFGERAGTDR